MGKLIFILLIVLLAYWLFKSRKHSDTHKEKFLDAPEDMVQCAHCGVHLPESESIVCDGHFFCNDEHYQKYIASKP